MVEIIVNGGAAIELIGGVESSPTVIVDVAEPVVIEVSTGAIGRDGDTGATGLPAYVESDTAPSFPCAFPLWFNPVTREVSYQASSGRGYTWVVLQQGATGADGIAGPQGDSLGYIHTQANPADVWEISHTLGKFPSVTVVDSGGDECEGDVQYVSNSQIVVQFCAPFGGKAYLN